MEVVVFSRIFHGDGVVSLIVRRVGGFFVDLLWNWRFFIDLS